MAKLFKRYYKEILIGLIIALLGSNYYHKHYYYKVIIPSESMETTIMPGDKVLVSKNIDDMKVGQIYTFYRGKILYIKRLIAIGGDHVVINNNDVYVNNKKLTETYVSSDMTSTIYMDLVVPEGKYFFLGDNRNNSNDARYWDNHFIDKSDIDGRAVEILSPKNRKSNLNREF